jgi:hypothetical protein
MAAIVGLLLVVPIALNAGSTALAATPEHCILAGTHAGGARGFVALRPGDRFTFAQRPCRTTYYVAAAGPLHALVAVGPGLGGTVHSPGTKVDGLVSATDLRDGTVRGGGHANLDRLRSRLDTTRHSIMRVRIVLAVLLIALAVFAPARAVMGGPAAVTAALVLSGVGSTSVALLGLLTLAGAFAPRRALWLFFPAYLLVLVAAPETQSLALLGPHPWGAGRFYGIDNEIETLLLAPALVLGLAAAPLVLVTVGWSRAGADGGGILVLLSAYAVLALGTTPRRLVAAGAFAIVAGLAFVGVDALTGGHSHVTHAVLHGGIGHDLRHRLSVSWNGATGAWGRGVQSALSLAALVWVATRRPRRRVVDALLVGLAVSLLVNDTPQDVLFWGAVTGVGLRRSV